VAAGAFLALALPASAAKVRANRAEPGAAGAGDLEMAA